MEFSYLVTGGVLFACIVSAAALWLAIGAADKFKDERATLERIIDTLEDAGLVERAKRFPGGICLRLRGKLATDTEIEAVRSIAKTSAAPRDLEALRDRVRLMELTNEYESLEAVKNRLAEIQLLKRPTQKHHAEKAKLCRVMKEWEKLQKPSATATLTGLT